MREDVRIRVPRDLADHIDKVRGGVPRDRWVRDALARTLSPPESRPVVRRAKSSEIKPIPKGSR